MIVVKDRFLKLTPEEYFIWEEQQLLRHEYLNGEVYAMSGGTQNHGRIASNIIFIPHSAGYLRQKIILPRRGAKERQNQILFMRELNRRLNPIDKDKMNRLKTLKNPP